jgi:hypothetical protein
MRIFTFRKNAETALIIHQCRYGRGITHGERGEFELIWDRDGSLRGTAVRLFSVQGTFVGYL